MNIYLVKGAASADGYRDTGVIYDNMVEKPGSYEGHRKRISKKWIKEVQEGTFHGSFKMYVTDVRHIPYAKQQIKEAVEEYHMKLFEKHKAALQELADYSVLGETKWLDPKGDPIKKQRGKTDER